MVIQVRFSKKFAPVPVATISDAFIYIKSLGKKTKLKYKPYVYIS